MSTPNFQPRPITGNDVNGETYVRIWDAQKWAPFDEGKVIAYSDRPTVVIEHADGSHRSWVASLPWERIGSPAAATASGSSHHPTPPSGTTTPNETGDTTMTERPTESVDPYEELTPPVAEQGDEPEWTI